ncbi:MAG: carbohydrate ABC transporter permease [Clostridia bacterium]|nr:carbohydrate ABC transporter permease [Clostridia bacterium]
MIVLKWIKKNLLFVIVGLLLAAYAFSVIYSLLWGLLSTIKKYSDFINDPIGLPKQLDFSNWARAFSELKITQENKTYYMEHMLLNSVIYAVGCAFLQTLTGCVSAYLCSKYKFFYSKIIYGIVIVTMILPIVGSLPSEIQMLQAIGLYGTFAGVFVMKMNFLGLYFLVFYAAFKSISWSYAEAAFIDGASHFRVMTRIMLPLVKSTFLAIFMLNFIGYWNDYQAPMIYLANHPTMAYGLFYMRFVSTSSFGKAPMQLTGCMLLTIPCFVLFMIFQKRLMGNLTVGGIKG